MSENEWQPRQTDVFYMFWGGRLSHVSVPTITKHSQVGERLDHVSVPLL